MFTIDFINALFDIKSKLKYKSNRLISTNFNMINITC